MTDTITDKYFMSPDHSDISLLTDMLSYLNERVSCMTDGSRPLLNVEEGKYAEYIRDRRMSDDSGTWETVFDDFARLFRNVVVWESPMTGINITPPVNLPALAAAFYSTLFNPNFAQDESCGFLAATELAVISYMADLVGWDRQTAGGLFTFGGKGTNMYAVKMGLYKCDPDNKVIGAGSDKVIIISEKAHPCQAEVCDWLGIGMNNCIRVKTDSEGRMIGDELEQTVKEQIISGKKIACIIVSGGTTNEVTVDSISDAVRIRNKVVKEYGLNYIPHLHVDSVIGWAWLFFKSYDFEDNPLGMTDKEKRHIISLCQKISQVELADSFGADFHKTGFCPYISSIIMVRNSKDLYSLGNKERCSVEELNFGEYAPFEYSLELSRSCVGPISAFITLEVFGMKGMQELIYRLFSAGVTIRCMLEESGEFEVINPETEGFATLFVARKPNLDFGYTDLINQPPETIRESVDYNHQLFLYTRQQMRLGGSDVCITFSKSFTPHGCRHKTGALKLYQMSPLIRECDQREVANQLIRLKKEFDIKKIKMTDKLIRPDDFIYRGM